MSELSLHTLKGGPCLPVISSSQRLERFQTPKRTHADKHFPLHKLAQWKSHRVFNDVSDRSLHNSDYLATKLNWPFGWYDACN